MHKLAQLSDSSLLPRDLISKIKLLKWGDSDGESCWAPENVTE